MMVIIILLSLSHAYSRKPSEENNNLELDKRKKENYKYSSRGKLSKDKKVWRTIYNENFKSPKKSNEEKLKDYLKNRSQKLGIEPSLKNVKYLKDNKTPGGTHIFYEQCVNSIPVYGSKSSITINNDDYVCFTNNNFKQDIEINNFEPYISSENALIIVKSYLKFSGKTTMPKDSIKLTIFDSNEIGFKLAWQIKISAENPHGDWEVIIDAENGVVLNVLNQFMYYEGTGFVFRPDPLTSGNKNYGDDGIIDNSDANSSFFDNQRVSVPLRDITYSSGKYKLEGPYCKLEDVEAPNETFPENTTPVFNYNRYDQGFECVMVYYYVDLMGRRLEEFGYMVNDLREMSSDPHGENGADQSHFSRYGNEIVFGEGGVDDAEDADVILHEYGHAIQWNIAQMGNTFETKAIMEGCSDYWAASYSRAVNDYNWHKVFSWDGHNNFWPGRECNVSTVYRPSMGDYYEMGTIWSTALMYIWDDIGRDITDKLLLEAHNIWGTNPDMRDAAQAFIQADKNLYNGQHLDVIISAFKSKNLYVDASVNAGYYSFDIPFTVSGNTVGRPNDWDVQGSDGADYAIYMELEFGTVLDISTCANTNYDCKLEIFNADGSPTGYYRDDYCSRQSALNGVELEAGGYYIVVDGYNGETGDFEIFVDYANSLESIEIPSIPFLHLGSNVGKANNFNVQGTDGADVAYKLTLPHAATLEFNTCHANTNFNTTIEIFNASGSSTGHFNDNGGCYYQASILDNIHLNAGEYYIVVDGVGGAVGDYGFRVEYVADFETIYTYSVDVFNFSTSTVGLKDDWDLINSDGADYAFKLQLTSAKRLTISLVNSITNFDAKIEVFDENGNSTGYYNDDYVGLKPELHDIFLEEGVYYIVIDGHVGQTGNFKITINEENDIPLKQSEKVEFTKKSLQELHKKELIKFKDYNIKDVKDDFINLEDYKYELEKQINY